MLKTTQSQAPLVEALSRHIDREYRSFHMPGHKGGSGITGEWRNLLGEKALSLDLTEVEGLDDLHHPTGPISRAQDLAAALMGARTAFFLTNGVSTGIHAGIMALCGTGDKIIVPRHAHRSVYGAMILSGASPVYLTSHVHPGWGIPVGVDAAQVEAVLENHREAKCLVMVHPTYHGLASDLSRITALARERGIKVLADEAHGAHFRFSPEFPVPALQCGAFLSVQGWHKTMGSLTQSALLLAQDQGREVFHYLTILQSTSPSYLLMGSLDAARKHWAERGRELAERTLALADDFRKKIGRVKGFLCLDGETINSPALTGLDRTKLVLNSLSMGLNGFQLARELRETYRIQPEMAEYQGVTLMVTIGDSQEKLRDLLAALKDISLRFPERKKANPFFWEQPPLPEMKMLPGVTAQAGKRAVKTEHAGGEIAGEFICPYPPGIPLAVPGEVITPETIEAVKQIQAWGGHVQGPADLSGRTLMVVDR